MLTSNAGIVTRWRQGGVNQSRAAGDRLLLRARGADEAIDVTQGQTSGGQCGVDGRDCHVGGGLLVGEPALP